MTCIVTDANPAVESFTWTKDASSKISSKDVYSISTVYRNHTGRYTCSAANTLGSSKYPAMLQLDVLYGAEIDNIPNQEPHEGTKFSITCSGNSFPALTDTDVTWTKKNNSINKWHGKTLLIDNINRIDKGTYVCSVVIKLVPSVGDAIDVTGETTVKVDVLYRPTVTIFPNFTQYKVVENSTNLDLDCRVTDANPTPTVYGWYKDDSRINGYITRIYTIKAVQKTHTGSYTCDATNTVNNSGPSSTVHLDVLYGVVIQPFKKNEPMESTKIVVLCNVTSNPKVTDNDVKWTKNNNVTFRRSGQHLVFDNVHRKDSGMYVCSVLITLSPTIGQKVNVTGTSTVEVNVLYRPIVTISPNYIHYNIIENTTNLTLTCSVIDSNPAVTFYQWYKNGSPMDGISAAIYTIPTVLRSHTGNYTCNAKNPVGLSDPSSAIHLNVLCKFFL
ncbi:Hypothetical predicted protein [Mytilus galloprovincialis]|uniref:Ig-like domain-containing protein n=1 Tax=Mytilus galloprovincialis TaxID=29158 RepID=A0A8B6CCH8_MYTGA|nr:Hypothetical predicted protein [Mytilus galloprovincialis]